MGVAGCATQQAAHPTVPIKTVSNKVVKRIHKPGPLAPVKPHSQANATHSTVYPTLSLGDSGNSVLALNERLAQLGYLPVQIPSGVGGITSSNISNPPLANFSWRFGSVPSQLSNQWVPNSYTIMTQGAVLAFENQNGLTIDGTAGPSVWEKLLSSSAAADSQPYSYVLVSKSTPEKLQVWQNGNWVYNSLANTGVPAAPTQNGTFAVYLRYRSQTMRGYNPNGTYYVDPGIPYVNYFNGGDAIHGFVRASYGFPQSVGCVELPPSHAQVVWGLINYGTLVTVQGTYTGGYPSSNPAPTKSNPASTPGKGNTTGPSKGNTTGGNSGHSTGHSTGNSTGGSTGNTTGNSTGNTTGNTTGNATGGSTGNATGNSKGNTTGSGTGNSTGDTAGNTTGNSAGNVTGNTAAN